MIALKAHSFISLATDLIKRGFFFFFLNKHALSHRSDEKERTYLIKQK